MKNTEKYSLSSMNYYLLKKSEDVVIIIVGDAGKESEWLANSKIVPTKYIKIYKCHLCCRALIYDTRALDIGYPKKARGVFHYYYKNYDMITIELDRIIKIDSDLNLNTDLYFCGSNCYCEYK